MPTTATCILPVPAALKNSTARSDGPLSYLVSPMVMWYAGLVYSTLLKSGSIFEKKIRSINLNFSVLFAVRSAAQCTTRMIIQRSYSINISGFISGQVSPKRNAFH